MNIASIAIIIIISGLTLLGIKKIHKNKLMSGCNGDCTGCDGSCHR